MRNGHGLMVMLNYAGEYCDACKSSVTVISGDSEIKDTLPACNNLLVDIAVVDMALR